MSTYLDLVNKVLEEGGYEQNQLTIGTWDSLDAGRRLYPRVKRLVNEAWKLIQMQRGEWQFRNVEMNVVIYPRIKVNEGSRPAGSPPIGTVFRGQSSNFEFTVRDVIPISGDWVAGTAEAQLEFDANYVGAQLIPGETFVEVSPVPDDGAFVYLEKGSYNFKDVNPLLRSIQWATFVASKDVTTPIPVTYIPWENWLYQEISFTQGSRTVPNYVSQDFEGNVVFYPQNLDPFRISFIHDIQPQTFVDPEDEPAGLEEEYHDWIAWKALENLARFDKNPDLYSYAESMRRFYEDKAESRLMPIPSWGGNRFNLQGWP